MEEARASGSKGPTAGSDWELDSALQVFCEPPLQQCQHGGFRPAQTSRSCRTPHASLRDRSIQVRVENRGMDVALATNGLGISQSVRDFFNGAADVLLPMRIGSAGLAVAEDAGGEYG